MHRASLWFSLLVLVAPAQALAAAAPSPAMPGADAPLQQQFDAASDAQGAGNCAAALPVFARIADDRRMRPGTIAGAAVAVRRGICLIATGDDAGGEVQIAAGLPMLRAKGDAFAIDIGQAEYALGEAARDRYDHDAAVVHFRAVQAGPQVSALIRLAQVTAFDGGNVAIGYADQAIALLRKNPKPNKTQLANVLVVRGRALLNAGRIKEGTADLEQALALRGGLGLSVTLDEVTMRYDLAEAALLAGNRNEARTYLAYTGAGRISQSPFATAKFMKPPACGPETGLAPGDTAVVEFGIGDDGTVGYANTMFSRDGDAKAAAFARAVRQWRWNPEDFAKLPAFYRALTRVEVQCTAAAEDSHKVMRPLVERFATWAATQLPGIAVASQVEEVSLGQLRSVAADRGRQGQPAAQVAALGLAVLLDPVPTLGSVADADRAIALTSAAKLPVEEVNALRIARTGIAAEVDARQRRRSSGDAILASFAALSQDPAIAADPLAQDTSILFAIPARPAAKRDASIPAYSRVADDARLGEHHPLRQFALLRLANIAAEANRFDQAQAYFARTGLTEQQCALIGVTPAMRSSGADSSDYPDEALHMGFEGWVRIEFDIAADGHTAGPRPVIAYPPFVFAEAATRVARDFRYRASYRPNGGQACSAKEETVRFAIPKA